jgi:hypothetical protein
LTFADAGSHAVAPSRRLRTRASATGSSRGTFGRGEYGDVSLDDLNVVAVASFEGNIWAGEAKPALGFSSTNAETTVSAKRSSEDQY